MWQRIQDIVLEPKAAVHRKSRGHHWSMSASVSSCQEPKSFSVAVRLVLLGSVGSCS